MTFKLKMRLDKEKRNMQTSNAKQDFRSDDPVWVLLAELPVRDFLSDHDRSDGSTAGHLLQMVQELDVPAECVETIARLIAEFAEVSPVHYKQEGMEFPGWIRILCQKKIIDDANAARTISRSYQTEQAMHHSPMIPDFGTKMKGGWGCFLIQKGDSASEGAPVSSHHLVDLYLYREG